MTSSSLGAPQLDNDEDLMPWPYDEELELRMEADDEDDGGKPGLDSNKPGIDPKELEILQGLVIKGQGQKQPSGDKRGLSQLNGSALSESLGEDLDAKASTKVAPNPSQWTDDDIDLVCQYCYKTDVNRFQTYRSIHIDLGDLDTINVKDHSTYIYVAKASVGMVIEKSVFSVVSFQEILRLKGGDMPKFDKEINAKFKKLAKGSWALDDEKVSINWIMLVCQCPNGVDVTYANKDGFGHPGMMGLWDLHSHNALNQVKLQLKSGVVDANFSPLCTLWSTNNEMLNNHIQKHYRMGLTCRADGFTKASISTMKLHMEQEHGYEGKIARQKKRKGKA